MTIYNLYDHQVDLDFDHSEEFLEKSLEKINQRLETSTTHGYFDTPQGKLHYCKFLPSDGDTKQPKGVIVFAHGIQAHCSMGINISDEKDGPGNFTNMALLSRKATAAGYVLYSFDLLGHGISEGKRFYIPEAGNWKIHRDHLETFAKFAHQDCASASSSSTDSDVPLFLMGESWGGNLALHVARMWQDDPENAPSNSSFKGIVLNAPAIVGDLPPKIVTWLLKDVLTPRYPTSVPFFMPHPITPDRIWENEKVKNHNTSESEQMLGMSGSGRKFCLGTATGLVNALEEVRNRVIPGFNVPFCVSHGKDDLGVKVEGTEYLLEHSVTSDSDRKVRIIEGALHDLMSDTNTKDETVDSLLSWVDSRL